nr:ABC-ATPase domain-containing protein [Clostridiales bacterium]
PDERGRDTLYFDGDIGYEITPSGKGEADRPTVVIQIPCETLSIDRFTTAAADFCLRAFIPYIDSLNSELYNRSRPDSENGAYYIYRPGGEITVNNSGYFTLCRQKDYTLSGLRMIPLDDGVPRPPRICLCIRLQVQLPRGKLKKAIRMLCSDLPKAAEGFVSGFSRKGFELAADLGDIQTGIREWLKSSEYCAFIADGSVLPRISGSDLPAPDAIPFQAPDGSAVTVAGICGMGIRRGVTVITGGGYSGKTTVLDAVASGIYDHVRGDGRELCVTDDTAVSISAEDGRSVKNVNISPFIKWLPGGDAHSFSTPRASGSTSQAANIMEAVGMGSRLLIIDEDRSAANFMIRDRAMKALIDKEPITPLTDRVRELADRGVSTLLVIGGSGEYLGVADKVYRMEGFVMSDATDEAAVVCGRFGISADVPENADWSIGKRVALSGWTSYPERSGSERMKVSELDIISVGDEDIDVRGLHDIISAEQLQAAGFIIRMLMISHPGGDFDAEDRLGALYDEIGREGLDIVYSGFFTGERRFLSLPRKRDVMAVLNRMRKVRWKNDLKG